MICVRLFNSVNRQNTARLEEKEKRERELLSRIIVEADDYKVEFHRKRQITSETNRLTNREKEQVHAKESCRFTLFQSILMQARLVCCRKANNSGLL